MRAPRKLLTFTNRYPLIGPLMWILEVQYFIAQIVAARAWPTPYDTTFNPISDLGNTACGTYSGRYVCSPLAFWMNASFVVLGVSIAAGSLLIYQGFSKKNTGNIIGFTLLGLGGAGTVMVGIFPENANTLLHSTGAGLAFVAGNVAMIVLGRTLEVPKYFRNFTVVFGLLGLTALLLMLSHVYLGLGPGGMERVTAYPQTVWTIVFGVYISGNRFQERARQRRRRLAPLR